MKVTISKPNLVKHRFQAAVPARQRSRLVARLLERELAERDNTLAAACRAANQDRALVREIEEWHAFEDGMGE
jgi:hypothetical protein